jgi:hypothetical protein
VFVAGTSMAVLDSQGLKSNNTHTILQMREGMEGNETSKLKSLAQILDNFHHSCWNIKALGIPKWATEIQVTHF